MKNTSWLIGVPLLLVTSCYEEVFDTEPGGDLFEMRVSPATRDFIFTSRDTGYTVEDPVLQLHFNDQLLDMREIRVRGKSALDFKRKSYAVFLNEPISVIDRYGSSVKELKRFKLLALAMDYTYIEDRVALGILQEAGVMPLFFKFVEFRLNGETQGVYLLVEDPEQYYKDIGSEFILRRGYDHHIDDFDYYPSKQSISQETYILEFQSIYSSLTQYQGEQLYQALEKKLDLTAYFRKIGIDYLLKNGDYTDEVFLYATVEDESIRYHPIPWDYDDIFASNPHEIGRTWGMGTLFGKRTYSSEMDIYKEIGSALIYSIEDDLDFTIARDPYLYEKYREVAKTLFSELDPEIIRDVFQETKEELTPFYNSYSVIEQSKFDRSMTTREVWEKNMKDKQEWLIERLLQIRDQLE